MQLPIGLHGYRGYGLQWLEVVTLAIGVELSGFGHAPNRHLHRVEVELQHVGDSGRCHVGLVTDELEDLAASVAKLVVARSSVEELPGAEVRRERQRMFGLFD